MDWTEFLLGLGLIGSRQPSGPERPQVLAWQGLSMVEAGSDTGTRGSWLRMGRPRANQVLLLGSP